MQKAKTKLVFPIFIPHQGCPFKCVYCDQNIITSHNDDIRIARNNKTREIDWDKTLLQVANFVKKHGNQYKEIAFFGGSFTCLAEHKMTELFKQVSAVIDENTYYRISTRPDAITTEILSFLILNRVKTIELGVQSFSDIELSASKRGYNSETAIMAAQMVKSHGFNLTLQFLIGLPQADENTYSYTLDKLQELHPEYVRLYPLIVLKNTDLAKENYTPLSLKEAIDICSLFLKTCLKKNIEVIKIGLHSDISPNSIVAGPYHPNIGEMVWGKVYHEMLGCLPFKEIGDMIPLSPRAIACLKSLEFRVGC